MVIGLKRLRWNGRVGGATKVNLFKDSWNMFWQIVALWWKLKVKKQLSLRCLAKRTNARAISDKPKMSIIPAQKTNHSLGRVMLTR